MHSFGTRNDCTYLHGNQSKRFDISVWARVVDIVIHTAMPLAWLKKKIKGEKKVGETAQGAEMTKEEYRVICPGARLSVSSSEVELHTAQRS